MDGQRNNEAALVVVFADKCHFREYGYFYYCNSIVQWIGSETFAVYNFGHNWLLLSRTQRQGQDRTESQSLKSYNWKLIKLSAHSLVHIYITIPFTNGMTGMERRVHLRRVR